jgi:prepilin-type N-terminal cleavage/methylation domain-containing protein
MNRKGFTLVELLAVIVILAIILAIAIPGISGVIESSTKNAFESDAKMLLKEINYKMMEDSAFKPSDVNETTITSLLNISNSNYQTVSVSILNGKPYVIIQGKNKWNGLLTYGTYQSMDVEDNSNYSKVVNQLGYDSSRGVNEPKLATGMTPIKWNGTSWVDTTTSDSDWYNYNTTDKKWANARTADGSMWVWIPRYIYKISSGWHSNTTGTIDIQFSKGIEDNWNSDVIGNIDTDQTSNASNNKWTNHPAFDFGSTKLTGIWVAKFEATASEGVSNGYISDGSCPSGGDNVTTKTIKILPNIQSWRCITVGNMFTNTRNMETNSVYGWGTTGTGIDTHLMKNTEWGVVAYLSKSNYGQGTNEIWINPANNFTTGCAGTSATSGSTTGCTNAYNSANGVHASTTGNIYGIYDVSGGAWEYVAAYVNNGNSNLSYGASITSATSQYKDAYTVGVPDSQTNTHALTMNFKGDAVYETSSSYTGTTSWFSDYSSMPYASGPWFIRGGAWSDGSITGAFAFESCWRGTGSYIGFRPVLAVSSGL